MFEMTVMSYNVLAHAYTIGTNVGNYKNIDLKVLQDIHYRATRVLREVEESMPNIICM